MAVAFIKGMQGDDPHYFKVIATAKHYAVHSGPESSRHEFDVAFYCTLVAMKLLVLHLALIPWIAIRLVLKSRSGKSCRETKMPGALAGRS